MKYTISFLVGSLLIAPLTYFGLGLNHSQAESSNITHDCEAP